LLDKRQEKYKASVSEPAKATKGVSLSHKVRCSLQTLHDCLLSTLELLTVAKSQSKLAFSNNHIYKILTSVSPYLGLMRPSQSFWI